MKVFLGGTCNESTWRDELIPQLKIDYFNPVVNDWTVEYQPWLWEEIKQRDSCDFLLYVITPKMVGFYSIAEVVDDSHKQPGKVVYCRLWRDDDISFTDGQLKSFEAIEKMLERNGVSVFCQLDNVAHWLNSQDPQNEEVGIESKKLISIDENIRNSRLAIEDEEKNIRNRLKLRSDVLKRLSAMNATGYESIEKVS